MSLTAKCGCLVCGERLLPMLEPGPGDGTQGLDASKVREAQWDEAPHA